MLGTLYVVGFSLAAGLQLGGALQAVRAGELVTPRDLRLMALNAFLWFVFLPSILYSLWRKHRARQSG